MRLQRERAGLPDMIDIFPSFLGHFSSLEPDPGIRFLRPRCTLLDADPEPFHRYRTYILN
jgi:hypothetical protein